MANLKLDNVSLGYGGNTILRAVSMEINPGELVGIIGPNGAGKSTLIKGIARLITPTSGKIRINGHVSGILKHSDLARILAVVPQNAHLPETFTALELVLMGRTPHLGFFQREGQKDLEIVTSAMETTKTAHLSDRKISELSGGEKQRLLIARALVQEPHIMLLDEPTSHLDISYQVETLEMVRSLCREKELVILAALHDLNLAVQYCDRLIILSKGRVYAQGKPQEIISASTIKDVYGADVLVCPHPLNNLPTTFVTGVKANNPAVTNIS